MARYVVVSDAGRDPLVKLRRPRSIDPFMGKTEEWVDKSQGKIRADVVLLDQRYRAAREHHRRHCADQRDKVGNPIRILVRP
ncbi:hypothetical protein ACIRRA_30620 [Nocardia sp. NPDC101769]|uniref:hypothetical protein n=1 Tax=Nocardia sp. NPDC101769 TaxID=3364333 RepID=UPI003823C91A